jgi:tRNA dimethylallyltransferase
MKPIAIVGPTASGKSDAALEIATKINANILSIDSLSIYKEIDIASAKPSLQERHHIPHFGIDVLAPNEHFNVSTFIKLYQEAKALSQEQNKALVIVGGTSFYLKALMTGLSEIPEISDTTHEKAKQILGDLTSAYALLKEIDPEYMARIEPQDRYRIEKMLHLYMQTGQTPSQWFAAHPPQPLIKELTLYNIDIDRDILRQRIALRTQKMLDMGLIDEVASLEFRYGRAPNSMKAIGIVEVLEYLDGHLSYEAMREAIITHTAQLAKRQHTFNTNQFDSILHVSVNTLLQEVLKPF